MIITIKYKVLFFDSWKGGIHNFKRLTNSFKSASIECLMVHLGSWGNEDELIVEEVFGNLTVRDISFYKNQNFKAILELEKPDLVLFLSTHTFAHRAVIRYCRFLSIPTINLYHGLVRVQDVDTSKGPYKASLLSYSLFAIKRLPKMLTKTLPSYIRSLIDTKANKNEWRQFRKNLMEIVTRPSALRVADDATPTRCLVYVDADKQHAIKTYKINPQQVFAVGNADIIDFNLPAANMGMNLLVDATSHKYVMYIDTALPVLGLIVKDHSEYIAHILHTSKELKKQGKELLFKPHPETKKLVDFTQLYKNRVIVVENSEFMTRLSSCCAVVTEPSSLSLIPALIGMPLLLVQYPPLDSLRYGQIILEYPRARVLNDVSLLTEIIKSEQAELNSSEVLDWIADNSGPMPASDMPLRVANHVIDLLES